MSSKTDLTESQSTDNASLQTKSKTFVELFEADKSRLYAYIYVYVLNHAAADDIIQETSLIMWREFDSFELGTNFSKWANVVAFNRIMVFKRTNKRYILDLGDDLLADLQQTMAEDLQQAENKPDKWWHLQHCTTQLSEPLKKIYRSFYVEDNQANEIAEVTGRSIHAIRKSVHKLRKKLFDCIEHKTDKGSS
ncbi:sigma-70 family RNA polymerase sigma factor [Algibacillus agarilyticus]|uniref:sigma-70 family RNA polymerase sigma factor n=1 Tax=Algibacillus agarilyticus TaxID=2234133 RepID=UPI001E2B22F9|nr:sigma-70 family RNA polymerase sigma factor [Algibacillus agarilyticus]